MTQPTPTDAAVASPLPSCEAAWHTALAARGIVCDDAQRARMAAALPHLDRMRQRLRAWRPLDDSFDARFEQEPPGVA